MDDDDDVEAAAAGGREPEGGTEEFVQILREIAASLRTGMHCVSYLLAQGFQVFEFRFRCNCVSKKFHFGKKLVFFI